MIPDWGLNIEIYCSVGYSEDEKLKIQKESEVSQREQEGKNLPI